MKHKGIHSIKRKVKVSLVLSIGLLLTHDAVSQFGGKQSFDFLELPKNAKTAVIGGLGSWEATDNAADFLVNPAALDSIKPLSLSFGHQFYFAGTGHSVFGTALPIRGFGNLGIGFENITYGEFDGFDQVGNATGRFKASENALTIGASHQMGAFMVGANMKLVSSVIEQYSASGMLFDIGGIFRASPSTTIALKVAHLGTFLSKYTIEDNNSLPLDVNITASIKPEHMPVRFHITIDELVSPNTRYETTDRKSSVIDHFRLGTEFLISRSIEARAGYDFGVRRELKLEQASGGAGLGLGMLIKLKKASIAISRTYQHVSGGTVFISLNANINYFKKGI